jgi:hypothetical protein
VGTYALNRVVVTRTYSQGNIGNSGISPGTQTLSPSAVSAGLKLQLGWNYNWPDPVMGPNINEFIMTYYLYSPPTIMVPCDTCVNAYGVVHSGSSLSGYMYPIVNSTGYGVDRDHTATVSGAAGSQEYTVCCNPDVTSLSGDPIINFSNNFDVPPAYKGEVTVSVFGAMNFGSDVGSGTLEVDFIYDPGPAACPSYSYSLKLPAQFPDAGGGSFNVGVTAPQGCTWGTMVSYNNTSGSPGALSVLGSGSGTGNGSVTLTELANTSAVYLSWVVNIAGQLVGITQPPRKSSTSKLTWYIPRARVVKPQPSSPAKSRSVAECIICYSPTTTRLATTIIQPVPSFITTTWASRPSFPVQPPIFTYTTSSAPTGFTPATGCFLTYTTSL